MVETISLHVATPTWQSQSSWTMYMAISGSQRQYSKRQEVAALGSLRPDQTPAPYYFYCILLAKAVAKPLPEVGTWAPSLNERVSKNLWPSLFHHSNTVIEIWD